MKRDADFYRELEVSTAAALFVRAASIGLGNGTMPHHRQCDLARSALAAARAFVATAQLTDQFVPYQPAVGGQASVPPSDAVPAGWAGQLREFDIAPLTPPRPVGYLDGSDGPKPAPVLG